jgi:hypothetical protein
MDGEQLMTGSPTDLPTPASGPETRIQKEQRIFREQMARLVNTIVNNMFDLKARSALNRLAWLTLLFFGLGFLISLKPHPLSEWTQALQDCFLYLFNPAFAVRYYNGNPLINLFWLGFDAYFNPYTLQHLPIFLIPFFIAHQAASFYLADIFELRNVSIARKFIRQVALTGSKDSIRFTEGEVLQEHFESPIYQIGGPGKVIVDLDSIVLFEKADGRPHVIGPTEKEPGGKAELEGFERVRQVIDLRDHHIHLNDSEQKPVRSRSLDGIPVSATDVRMMYSIYRGEKPTPTPDLPYPFTQESVEQLVYKSTSKVLLDQQYSSGYVFKGMDSIINLVRGEFSKFMSEKKLIEYLASIAKPEVDKAEERENAILEEANRVLSPHESIEKDEKKVPPIPSFTPRHEITSLFSQFTKKFTLEARKKGMELHWVGIGTWKIPSEIVPEKHLEAWKLSGENIGRGDEKALKDLRLEAELQKTLSLIQNVPLAAYHEVVNKHPKRDDAIRDLLFEYQRLINDNFELLHNRKKRIPPTLVVARHFVRSKIGHYVPRPPPPLPASQRGDDLYQQLLKKIGFFEAIEELIDLEREFEPDASLEELLDKINRDWDLDIEGKW